MDLSTRYLGLALPHPFIAGASPLTEDLDAVRRLEDAGAAMIVLPSLFEEQVRRERRQTLHHMEVHGHSFGEALTYFPDPADLRLGPENYLEHLRRTKEALRIPIVASLNGVTDTGWLDYARLLEEAGADAIELNIYFVATDPAESGNAAERKVFDIAARVRQAVRIPVAVKLSPYFSSFANVARKLDGIGVDGLVLFNRFFHADIDLEVIEMRPSLSLSTPEELPLRLAWIGLLWGRVKASLAVTGGVHRVEDAVKAVMSGADGVQVVSALLRNGPRHLTALHNGLGRWLEENEYESLEQMKGSMSLSRCPDPAVYERGNYMRMLQGWGA